MKVIWTKSEGNTVIWGKFDFLMMTRLWDSNLFVGHESILEE